MPSPTAFGFCGLLLGLLFGAACSHQSAAEAPADPPTTPLTWGQLATTTFTPTYIDSLAAEVMMPNFSPQLQDLEGRWVTLKGYVIPIEETGDSTVLVLSANPFSACFFCGAAGPETIADVQLADPASTPRFIMDQQVTFRGRLRLNSTNFYFFNFILEDAEWVPAQADAPGAAEKAPNAKVSKPQAPG